jgi:hypothetical protein
MVAQLGVAGWWHPHLSLNVFPLILHSGALYGIQPVVCGQRYPHRVLW